MGRSIISWSILRLCVGSIIHLASGSGSECLVDGTCADHSALLQQRAIISTEQEGEADADDFEALSEMRSDSSEVTEIATDVEDEDAVVTDMFIADSEEEEADANDFEAQSEISRDSSDIAVIASDVEHEDAVMTDMSVADSEDAESSLHASFAKGGHAVFENSLGLNDCKKCFEKLWLKEYPRTRKCMKRCMKGATTRNQARARHPPCNRKCGGRASKRVRAATAKHCKTECTIRQSVKPPPACKKCIQKQWKTKAFDFRRCLKGCKNGGQCKHTCVQKAHSTMQRWTTTKCKAQCPPVDRLLG